MSTVYPTVYRLDGVLTWKKYISIFILLRLDKSVLAQPEKTQEHSLLMRKFSKYTFKETWLQYIYM